MQPSGGQYMQASGGQYLQSTGGQYLSSSGGASLAQYMASSPRSGVRDLISQEILSPRSLGSRGAGRPLSPRAASPTGYRAPALDASTGNPNAAPAMQRPSPISLMSGPDLQAVLALVERQGQLDQHIEEIKGCLPAATPIETIFGILDFNRKGYVTDTDLWQFAQKFGRLPFSSIFTLIREIQNGRHHDTNFAHGQLSLREVGVLMHKKGTQEHQAMDASTTDEEAQSSLYVQRFTEPCPGCGIRIQRDADAAGCPNVTCPVCRKSFQCYTLMGDVDARGQPHPVTDTGHLFNASLPNTVQHDIYRIIEVSAGAADEVEGLRKQLTLTRSEHMLSDTFAAISGGKHCFTFIDLRKVLFEHKFWSSERELQLIWQRYARGADHVTLAGFAAQLQPVMGRA